MEQLVQKLKSGNMKILNVPIPQIKKKHVIVKNYFSLISAGTETSSVMTARKGYLGKAKEKPQQVKQVIDSLKAKGPVSTYRAVMKKLDAYSSLGYSCAGEVINVADDVNELKVGDLIACGGFDASHAEVVCVPVNLCVKLYKDANLKVAAYNTLGAIALQGIRQADLKIGETCCIIGMGLLGQITAKILKASGVKVVGTDIDSRMIQIGKEHCLDLALERNELSIQNKIIEFCDGLGCDAVIITAASSSLDPINFAGAVARQRGTIVIVGAVPTGFDREPYFYKKELQLKMSCSYGPGRYDPVYEEKGIDYPPAYVRWTQKRNMQAFQDLVYTGQVDVSYLTTHIFKLQDAVDAYEMMLNKKEHFIGILIEYDRKKQFESRKVQISLSTKKAEGDDINIGFIGSGSYAQSHLLPNIPKDKRINLEGVLTTSGISSRSVAERYGFEFCTSNQKDILDNNEIDTVFIATRHDSHGKLVIKALEAGKNVFVEKPLCMLENELKRIADIYQGIHSHGGPVPLLMIGYNRRFSPLTKVIKEKLNVGPMAMIYRINAGSIPSDSWIQDPDMGGGRIVGEACHFIDYLTFVNGSLPISVFATAMDDSEGHNDIVNISLNFRNGSIGTICYFSNGDRSLPKERVEIYQQGCSAVIDDFKTLWLYADGKKEIKKLMRQNKGQKEEVKKFIWAVCGAKENVIPFKEIYSASLATFKVVESIQKGVKLDVTQR